MSVTINIRTLFGFAAGFVIAAVMFSGFRALTADAVGSNESTFVPITPCRLFDTRPGATNIGPRNSPLGEDSSYSFQVTGANGDCTIPAAATAVSINLTGVSPTAATNLRLYPANADVPNASVLNMTAGQAPTPNKLDVKLSPDGRVSIYNRFGSVHVVGDVMGYYRHDGIAELEARIAELETLTASMSTAKVDGQPAVRFTGVNVQIVSGSGATDGTINGTGNLIVGYNENDGDTRTGSHNLVVGDGHSYTSYAGAVLGVNNQIDAEGATVTGGYGNHASGLWSTVGGGVSNSATGARSSVNGGENGVASGTSASVAGGQFNEASGDRSSVAGGSGNTAGGFAASVAGGTTNSANTQTESVAGGDNVICSSGSNNVVCGEGTINPAD